MTLLKEYMTTNVESSKTSDDLKTLAEKMEKDDVGFLPVVENDKYAGVVTDRDIVVKGLAKGTGKAEDIMTENVVTGSPDMEVEEAAKLMQDHQIKRLLVVDDDAVNGVVTLGDLGVENADQVAGNIISEVSKGKGNN
ncbi:CBS domain-containing protein [Halobacillus karajensis]|uniref:CBS domain-containing protein n=1 Tax=Halobacillus karajensis TaxID=195088 RepID=UPI0008A75E48|nr:CBS domain-containing protein [Halobacillus karajensis]SEI14241.1 CBS domain-containing protein [Halobacillus karajensis]